MDVTPGAEPFRHEPPPGTPSGRRTGVVLCHGFTGSPASLRPWAEHLAETGYGVEVPLLPGHGTSWKHLNRTQWPDWFAAVERSLFITAERYDTVVVAGLSMGGCLALRLAQVHGQLVDGLVLVNPVVTLADPRLTVLPVLRYLTPSVKGISNDIARPDQDEVAYDRTPLHALYSQTKLWRIVEQDLPLVTQPIAIYHSATDHVLDESSVPQITRNVSSSQISVELLANSFHVATLDYDAPGIFTGSIEFIENIVHSSGIPDTDSREAAR